MPECHGCAQGDGAAVHQTLPEPGQGTQQGCQGEKLLREFQIQHLPPVLVLANTFLLQAPALHIEGAAFWTKGQNLSVPVSSSAGATCTAFADFTISAEEPPRENRPS